MKTGWLMVMGIALLGLAGFSTRLALSQRQAAKCIVCEPPSRASRDVLGWTRKQLGLSEPEFQQVCALHDAYVPRCDAMCERMEAAGTKLSAELLKSDGKVTPEGESALREYEEMRVECQRAILQHLQETAAVMKPETRRAFLQQVLPHLLATHQHVSEIAR